MQGTRFMWDVNDNRLNLSVINLYLLLISSIRFYILGLILYYIYLLYIITILYYTKRIHLWVKIKFHKMLYLNDNIWKYDVALITGAIDFDWINCVKYAGIQIPQDLLIIIN